MPTLNKTMHVEDLVSVYEKKFGFMNDNERSFVTGQLERTAQEVNSELNLDELLKNLYNLVMETRAQLAKAVPRASQAA